MRTPGAEQNTIGSRNGDRLTRGMAADTVPPFIHWCTRGPRTPREETLTTWWEAMTRTYRGLVALAFGLCLAGAGQPPAQGRPGGVGPNGEVDGLSAKFVDVNGVRTRYFETFIDAWNRQPAAARRGRQ